MEGHDQFVWDGDDVEEVIELDDGLEQSEELTDEMEDLTVDDNEMEKGGGAAGTDDAVTVFSEHTKSVFSVSLDPVTASVAASGGEDDRAFVWSIDDGRPLFEMTGHKDSVTCTTFSHDGKLVATGDMSGVVKVWRLLDGKEVWTFECGDLEWLCWHFRTHVLFAGTTAGELWMWKVPDGDCKMFQSYGVATTCGKILPDGKQVAAGYADGSVKVWNLKSAAATVHISGRDGHQDGVTCIDCSEDGSLLLTGSSDGLAKLISTSGKVVANFTREASYDPTNDNPDGIASSDKPVSVEAVAFCHSLRLAAVGYLDGRLTIWDVASQRVRQCCEHKSGIVRLQWHSLQPLVYACSLDGVVCLWDGRTGQLHTQWRGHSDQVLDMAVSKDGDVVVTGSDDCTARVFKHRQSFLD